MSDKWGGDERRDSQFNVKSQLMKAIDAENDPKMRNTYMLMLGIIEAMDAGFGRIEKKIDHILHDEAAIKRIVLNGHNETHHEDHDWIAERRKENCSEACKWAKQKMAEDVAMKPVCDWATKKMNEEAEMAKDKKSLWMKFLESIVSHVGTAVAVGFIAWVALK